MRRLAPHWGQRELMEAYYESRANPNELLVAYQMNWKGENFYTGNHLPVFVSTGGPFTTWMKAQRDKGAKVMYFVTEHSRIGVAQVRSARDAVPRAHRQEPEQQVRGGEGGAVATLAIDPSYRPHRAPRGAAERMPQLRLACSHQIEEPDEIRAEVGAVHPARHVEARERRLHRRGTQALHRPASRIVEARPNLPDALDEKPRARQAEEDTVDLGEVVLLPRTPPRSARAPPSLLIELGVDRLENPPRTCKLAGYHPTATPESRAARDCTDIPAATVAHPSSPKDSST